MYGIHSDLVAEQVAGDRLAVARAGQGVDGRRVGVDHEPAGDERVEHALHGRPPVALVAQPRGHRDPHDRVAAGLGLAGVAVDERQQRGQRERHQRSRP